VFDVKKALIASSRVSSGAIVVKAAILGWLTDEELDLTPHN
jgi:hypothetical protein